MLEAGVQVGLSREQHDVLEVSVVDVGVHSEQAFEDHLDDVHEVLGELHSQLTGEDLLIVELVLHPSHQEVDVLSCTHLQGSLHIVAISPEVFILGAS